MAAAAYAPPLRALCTALRQCDAIAPRPLLAQLLNAESQLRQALQDLQPALSSSILLLIAPEGSAEGSFSVVQLLVNTFRQLRLLLASSAGRSPALLSKGSEAVNFVAVADQLLFIITLAIVAAEAALERSAGPGAAAASSRAMAHLAASQPCSALAAALMLGGTATGRAVGSLRAAQVSALLLKLTLGRPRFADALLPELRDTGLLALACECIQGALGRRLKDPLVLNVLQLLEKALFGISAAAVKSTPSALCHLLLDTPELLALQLAVVDVWGQDASADASHILNSAVVQAAWWLRGHTPNGGVLYRNTFTGSGTSTSVSTLAAKTPGSACVTAASASQGAPVMPAPFGFALSHLHVQHVMRAAARHRSAARAALSTATTMWQQLPAAEQGRAFFEILPYAKEVLGALRASLLPTLSSGPAAAAAATAALASEDGSVPGSSNVVGVSIALVSLLRRCVLPFLPGDCASDEDSGQEAMEAMARGAASWKGLQPRAYFIVFRDGLLGSFEAVLRAAGRSSPVAELAQLGSNVSLLGLALAALLLTDRQAATAMGATLSVGATAAKRLLSVWADADRRRRTADFPSAPVTAVRSANEGAVLSMSALGVSTASLLHMFGNGLLREGCEAGGAAATQLLQCCVMQLLPPTIRTMVAVRRDTSAPFPPAHASAASLLLVVVVAANGAGMAALTAAAGAPELLFRLLTPPDVCNSGDSGETASSNLSGPSRCSSGSSRVSGAQVAAARLVRLELAAFSAVALVVAGNERAWQTLRARMGLVAMIDAAWTDAGNNQHLRVGCVVEALLLQRAPAVLLRMRPPASSGTLLEAVKESLVRLCLQDGRCAEDVAPTRKHRQALQTWMLQADAEQRLPLSIQSPAASSSTSVLFSCWNRHCVNLGGETDAALATRKCGGCARARYCTEACQRRAWRSGHRAACQEWMRSATVDAVDLVADDMTSHVGSAEPSAHPVPATSAAEVASSSPACGDVGSCSPLSLHSVETLAAATADEDRELAALEVAEQAALHAAALADDLAAQAAAMRAALGARRAATAAMPPSQ